MAAEASSLQTRVSVDAIDGKCTRFQDWVVRKRSWIFGAPLVFYLLAFNGQWRVGRGLGLGL